MISKSPKENGLQNVGFDPVDAAGFTFTMRWSIARASS
jgi:hypothetical protein